MDPARGLAELMMGVLPEMALACASAPKMRPVRVAVAGTEAVCLFFRRVSTTTHSTPSCAQLLHGPGYVSTQSQRTFRVRQLMHALAARFFATFAILGGCWISAAGKVAAAVGWDVCTVVEDMVNVVFIDERANGSVSMS